MAYIPAICTNPACNCIFASGIDLLGKGVATFNNCAAGPCPQCGGIGKIPDGEYQFLRDGIFASLFNIPDITQLSRIKQILETAKNDAKFQEKLAAAAPELKSQSAVLDWAKENQVILDLISSVPTLNS